MKHFNSIREALNYQPHCPICHGRMEADVTNCDFQMDDNTITWKSDGDELIVDLDTNQIIKYTMTLNNSHYYAVNQASFRFRNPGLMYSGLRMQCTSDKCLRYDYTIQVIIQLPIGNSDVYHMITLNSEYYTFDEKGITHEIRNVHTTENTEYARFGWSPEGPWDEKTIVLPLIPLDLQNPNKTLERIKTLIPFS